MSSRPGNGPNFHRQRSQDSEYDDTPQSPAVILPSLRTLNSPRDRDGSRTLPPPTPYHRYWATIARRVHRTQRLRSFEEMPPAFADDSMDQTWHSSPRRTGRTRDSAEVRPPSDFEDLDRSLDEANTHLRALLDLTTHTHLTTPPLPYTTPTLPPILRPHDYPDDNRRNKRRKLESDRPSNGFKGFRYGKYGQVEVGELKMEIVSCDGGIYSGESQVPVSYAAENILKNDLSVYCTKGNRCNIILRHQGSTVFTLQELVIKAPASTNYSHPVREGMVFIAMDQDDMFNRTAQYYIQYAQTQRNRGSWARRSYLYRADEDDDSRVPQMPEEFAVNLPDFRITTECSDDEDDDEYGSRPFREPPPNIGSLPFENQDSDSDDLRNPFGSEDQADDLLLHHSRRQIIQEARRERERDSAGNVSLEEALDAHINATQEALRAVGGGELLTPHARFFIEKRKSKCTIRFDPPVSGRFILLKMWSSQHESGSNIDIQSVTARGFAGPRYFPAVELR
ncbi:hypothetical protein PT974_10691 [Cladobotryum mycophilum]|uniref:Eukaryotic translation initiation factor 6 n=1 Tax=Cladobotryum mycophilum TaxID=491253 RepID=A0ABR0SBJ2_9HYPO